jgi:hypothetical protein
MSVYGSKICSLRGIQASRRLTEERVLQAEEGKLFNGGHGVQLSSKYKI